LSFSGFRAHNFRIRHNRQTRSHKKAKTVLTASAHADAHLGKILRVLIDNATVVVSGTKLASELGTSRSEVWRLIQHLRKLGVQVGGHPATGYSLKSMPDLLLPELLSPLVKGTIFGKNIHHSYKAGSTNNAALEAANLGAPEGSVFLAEEQTAGRGRGDHSWHSERSTGIYCSIVLRPKVPPSDVLVLTLAAGLAVHAAVQEISAELPDLKWPNDLLIDGKKFCGILTEMTSEATQVRYVVVGIGINVNQSNFPIELQSIATSLQIASGTEYSRLQLCAALLKSLDHEYRDLIEQAGAHESILRRFAERSSSVTGVRVHVDENGGFEGITEGLDSRGFLQVRTGQGVRKVLSGMVTPR
jgi:BirA family transcriptional regulator, biotin operon repressor / biotin---[acetyl-CoA-carboxylase] ligase